MRPAALFLALVAAAGCSPPLDEMTVVDDILSDPGAVVVELTPTDDYQGSRPRTARLIQTAERSVIDFDGLADPGAGFTYQVWSVRDGEEPRSLGTFRPGSGGVAQQTLDAPRGGTILLTREPEGGSEAPSRPPLFTSDP